MQIDVNMQLSHMLANDIARSGEESAILDTVHTLKRTVTRDSLSADIQEVFHITIADSKLAGHVKNMLLDGRLIERGFCSDVVTSVFGNHNAADYR